MHELLADDPEPNLSKVLEPAGPVVSPSTMYKNEIKAKLKEEAIARVRAKQAASAKSPALEPTPGSEPAPIAELCDSPQVKVSESEQLKAHGVDIVAAAKGSKLKQEAIARVRAKRAASAKSPSLEPTPIAKVCDESQVKVPESERVKTHGVDIVAAAKSGNMEKIQLVCDHAPERVDDTDSVLMPARTCMILSVLWSCASQSGYTALHLAAAKDLVEMADLLLRAKATVDSKTNVRVCAAVVVPTVWLRGGTGRNHCSVLCR